MDNGRYGADGQPGCGAVIAAWLAMMLLAWLASRTFGTAFDPLAALALTGIVTAVGLWS